MWGKPKPIAVEETTFGWRDHNLKMLAKALQSERPLLQTVITGFRQGIKIDGLDYRSQVHRARTDRELYEKSALLFEGVPADEDTATMFETDNEFAGTFHFNQVRVKGSFSIADDIETLKTEGCLGRAFITTYDGVSDTPPIPVLEFHFIVADRAAESRLQSTLLTALANGSAYCNLTIDRPEDTETWVQSFRTDGYSPDLTIRRVFIGAEAGKGLFD